MISHTPLCVGLYVEINKTKQDSEDSYWSCYGCSPFRNAKSLMKRRGSNESWTFPGFSYESFILAFGISIIVTSLFDNN